MNLGHETYTFVHLFETARWIKPLDDSNGKLHVRTKKIACLTFLALSIEAFLNHWAHRELDFWDQDIEKNLNFQSKVKILHWSTFGKGPDYETRPLQTISLLKKFRDRIAHGKTEASKVDALKTIKELTTENRVPEPASWQKIMNKIELDRAFEDVENFIEKVWVNLPDGTLGGSPFENIGKMDVSAISEQ